METENIQKETGEVVFSWQLTREEFIHSIKEQFSFIKDADKFYTDNEAEIIRYFGKGFAVLISGCGATYETVMKNAIELALIDYKGEKN